MRILILFLALTAGGIAQQSEQPQPYDVKGVKLGSPLAEWRQGQGAACKEMPTGKTDEVSYICLGATYAGIKVQEVVGFFKGRLSSFYFGVSHDNYETLRDALKQKFGQPEKTEQKTYQNSYGAAFSGEYLLWSNGVSSITLEEIHGDREHSVLLFTHTDLTSEQVKAGKPKIKADDM